MNIKALLTNVNCTQLKNVDLNKSTKQTEKYVLMAPDIAKLMSSVDVKHFVMNKKLMFLSLVFYVKVVFHCVLFIEKYKEIRKQ